MDLLADLEARELVHDTTDRPALAARFASRPIGVYVGFDPTGDSLHVGHLLGQLMLRRFQLAGHRPITLAGGATGMVGDPSGRSEERNLLDRDTLEHNKACIKAQLERILDFEPGPYQARLVDNYDWTAPVPVLDFLRDVGKHFTVNQMVAKDSVRSRMESGEGISFTEFSYALLQAFDFWWLCENADCEMQMGGSDQWGNIVAGVELIRRRAGRPAYALTWPLLLRPDGTKFGKTAAGTSVWLDPQRTSPYQFSQFWVQSDDSKVQELLLKFSLRSVEEIRDIVRAHREHPERREAQRLLARDVTTLVHGPEAAAHAEAAAGVLFGADPTAAPESVWEMLSGEIPSSELDPVGSAPFVDILVRAGLATSKGDARRTLNGGGIAVNGRRVGPEFELAETDALHGKFVLLRKGKSSYHVLRLAAARTRSG